MSLLLGFLALASVCSAKTCLVPSNYASSNGTLSDSVAIDNAFVNCSQDSVIIFAEGISYNVNEPIKATNLSNVTIQMHGNLHLPRNLTYVQQLVNVTTANTNGSSFYWFDLSGTRINYQGTSNVTNGWIECYGQQWWDANPINGTGIAGRPHLMNFNTITGSMSYLKIRQPIAWNIALSGSDIVVTNTFIDAFSTGGFPFNTDGFDVKGNNISILDSTIFNGDDAIAVQAGSTNILFRGGTIGYQSHGMSIGSLGQNQASFASVSNITFDNIVVVNAVYGARFKSWIGGQGLAKNVTWKNIKTYNVTFPIFVTQSYFNQGASQTQIESGSTTVRPNNSSVVMQDFTFSNFTGTINSFNPGDGSCVTDPCWYNAGLPGLKQTESIILECNTNSSCTNFKFENIQVIPQRMGSAPSIICINARDSLNPQLGFQCANTTFIPRN